MIPWQTGKVIRIADETQTTRRFWIEMESGEPFVFAPGQFVTLDLPIHEKPNKRWRSYSIASWPDGTPIIELLIVYLEGGLGTQYLFNEVHIGTRLSVRGPLGFFTLPDPIEKDIFLVCTGTGIAPFRSMLHHVLNNNISHQEIHLIFGCRRLTDTLYQKEMESLQEQISGFRYLPVFSREVPENKDHLIRTGYVHGVYEEICKVNALSLLKEPDSLPDFKPAHFYLCGWKNMIDEARRRIATLGYDKKSVHFELYG